MLTLYVKTGCPYCTTVLNVVEELGIDVEQKNIAENAIAAELVEKGGKRQVPYLVDTDRDVAMYESEDIAAYFKKNYSKKKSEQEATQEVAMDDSFLDAVTVAPRVHRDPNAGVCIACEG